MKLRPFRTIPKDEREWARWMREQELTPEGTTEYSSLAVDDLIVGDITVTGDLLFTGSGLAYGEISAIDNATVTTIALQNVAVQVTIFDTQGQYNNTDPNLTSSHIAIQKSGVYFVAVSATINSISGASSRAEITVRKNNGVAQIIPHVDRNLAGGGGESGVISISGMASLAAGDTVEVWIENETNTQNYVVQDIGLSVMQIGGT